MNDAANIVCYDCKNPVANAPGTRVIRLGKVNDEGDLGFAKLCKACADARISIFGTLYPEPFGVPSGIKHTVYLPEDVGM